MLKGSHPDGSNGVHFGDGWQYSGRRPAKPRLWHWQVRISATLRAISVNQRKMDDLSTHLFGQLTLVITRLGHRSKAQVAGSRYKMSTDSSWSFGVVHPLPRNSRQKVTREGNMIPRTETDDESIRKARGLQGVCWGKEYERMIGGVLYVDRAFWNRSWTYDVFLVDIPLWPQSS